MFSNGWPSWKQGRKNVADKIGKKAIYQLVITIFLISFLAGCSGSTLSVKTLVPLDAQSPQGDFFLPLKIKWISSLYPDESQDAYRPLEYGAPTIDQDRIYVGTHFGKLLCLNAISGETIWSFQAYGEVASTPAVYGDTVIFGDSDGQVYSIRKQDGLVNWTYKVQGEALGRINVHQDKVLFTSTFNRLYALDARDGTWLWTHQRNLPDAFSVRGVSSPVTDGTNVYAGLADGYLIAVDIERGREVWKNLLVTGDRLVDVDTTPVLDGNRIFAAAYDGTLYCLDKENGDVVWKMDRGGIHPVTIDADALYFSDSNGLVYRLDKESGKEVWQFDVRNEDKRHSLAKSLRRKNRVPTSPKRFGPYLITASSSGYLYVLDPATGKINWRYLPGFGVTSGVVIQDGAIYFLTNSASLFKMVPSKYAPSFMNKN
jgi:outer membrane protein assembly factor BamB